ncbi:MAG TPA: VOC family protein [Acidimicrobiales bacterium]|nr:VOC family protein [Acidimicrobiales bacterium]
MAELARTRFRGPVLDARDAVELAHFYAALLDWTIKDEATGDGGSWALIEAPSGELKMEFQGADDYVPPVWPNAAGEQQMMMHIDIAVEVLGGDEDPRPRFFALVDHAVSLGARVAEHQPQSNSFTVMLDPAGHPFCLVPASAM